MKSLTTTRKWVTTGIAFAGLFVSANAFADNWDLSWNNIQLKAASGVPNNTEHQYVLTGALSMSEVCGGFRKFCGEPFDGWATITGKWDGHSQDVTENIMIEGDIVGSVSTHFKCNADPWIDHSTTCVKLSVAANQSVPASPGINWDSVYTQLMKPITSSRVSLVQAQAMSTAQANNQPPPPPPPPQKKPLVIKNAAVAKTHIQNIQKQLGFTPDPEPPSTFNMGEIKNIDPLQEQQGKVINPGEIRGFNPQPEPPGKVINPGEIRGFNPQPEPPGNVINPDEIQ